MNLANDSLPTDIRFMICPEVPTMAIVLLVAFALFAGVFAYIWYGEYQQQQKIEEQQMRSERLHRTPSWMKNR